MRNSSDFSASEKLMFKIWTSCVFNLLIGFALI